MIKIGSALKNGFLARTIEMTMVSVKLNEEKTTFSKHPKHRINQQTVMAQWKNIRFRKLK